MTKGKIAYIFFCGLAAGIVVAEGFRVLGTRDGWHVGGEVLMLPLFILLIYMGVMIGRALPKRGRSHEHRR
jgi:hypothetical protein